MKISFKLTASTLLLVALLIGSIVATFLVMNAMEKSLSTVVRDRLIPAKDLKRVGDLYAINIVDLSHKVRSGAISWEEGSKSIEEALSVSDKIWKEYLSTYLTAEEAEIAKKAGVAIDKGRGPTADLLKILAAHDKDGLDHFVTQRLYPSIDPITALIGELVDLQIRVGEAEYRSAAASKALNDALLSIFAGLAIVISALAVWLIFGGVSKPLNIITERMTALAKGNTDIDVPYAHNKDEIGAIAHALEVFREAALANIQLEREAEEARQRTEHERVEMQRKAEADAAERLRIATAGLAAGLGRLAQGDLTVALNEPFSVEFEPLRHDFNTSVRQLGNTLTEILGAISSMDNGTQEIANGTNDLSRRTEKQAAALEETAAALDEITVNVANSTKRTDEARAVANAANSSAAQSAAVVGTAEAAMRKIEESSRQISNIIGVIDEIAFQTNLLALNAGVEAARAGEAGKGFAVVAQEVRELAQRSAQAAKEIKTLILNSSADVDNGVKLVRDAGSALGTISTQIIEINQHVQAIALSSREQSDGLSQINVAVNQMDQTTQQNAAMVEEATAAASSLAQEASHLRSLVGAFTLDTPASQGALRRSA